jgi:hypothetical protein
VGGFEDALICGEEPELCLRLRQHGWRIERLGQDMSWHDARITRFAQWWKRNVRGGWAYAQGAAMYGRTSYRYDVRPVVRAWGWGVALPAAAGIAAWPTAGWSLLLLGGYGVLIGKIAISSKRRSAYNWQASVTYAVACTVGKWAEAQGQAAYWWHRLRRRPAQLIEYKQPEAQAPQQ